MSRIKSGRTENQGAPRLSFGAYNISRERYIELRDSCAAGKYSPETLSKACRGLEFIEPWVVLSVTKSKSYDLIEYDFKLGRIPVGRSDFYGFRRKFYHNLDVLLREDGGRGAADRAAGGKIYKNAQIAQKCAQKKKFLNTITCARKNVECCKRWHKKEFCYTVMRGKKIRENSSKKGVSLHDTRAKGKVQKCTEMHTKKES